MWTCRGPGGCFGRATTGSTATRLRPRGWVDAPSGSILQLYSVVYGGAARVFETVGDSALAARADSVAREVNRELSGRVLF